MIKYPIFLIPFFFQTLQAQTLDGNLSSIGKEEATATIQVTAIAGQPFGTAIQNDRLTYGFMELAALANEASELTGLTIDKKTASLETGSSLQLVANLLPEAASNSSLRWHSSHPSVASVSEGLVRGISAGTATITVTSAGGLLADVCVVTVTANTTAIDRIETGNRVYPTLVRTALTVELQQAGSIRIVNMQGKVYYSGQGQAGLNTVQMHTYPSGVYVVQLEGETFKVVKR